MRAAAKRALLRTGLYAPMWRLRGWWRRHDPATWLRNRQWRRRHHESLPLPPPALMWEVVNSADIASFVADGRDRAAAIERAFAAAGFDLAGARRVLDFGCGCGRVIRHWAERTATEWYGSDINTRLIAWCRDHLGFAEFEVNSLAPPLPHESGFFDAIYGISVLTHLDEDLQHRWLGELARLVARNGAVLLTTHGDGWLDGLDERERAQYLGGSIVVRSRKRLGSNLCEAYHPPAAFRAVAERFFGDVQHLPQGSLKQRAQDMWVLRRPLPPAP